jgi:predicted TIM-barrel fold metal-dependent hydrolase
MIIDGHVHVTKGVTDRTWHGFLDYYRKLGLCKLCLSACGDHFNQPDNKAVARLIGKFSGEIIGFGYVRLGIDKPALIGELHSSGFKGIKVINPLRNYDDEAFYPIYEKAERFAMPILFHTGVVSRTPHDGKHRVSSARMRPVYLDTIARAFPSLSLIAAHMGFPWCAEAAEVARMNPNVYMDLGGGIMNTRPIRFFREVIWRKAMASKFVFGSDICVGTAENRVIREVLRNYRRFLDGLGVSRQVCSQVFYGTMAKLLGLDEG